MASHLGNVGSGSSLTRIFGFWLKRGLIMIFAIFIFVFFLFIAAFPRASVGLFLLFLAIYVVDDNETNLRAKDLSIVIVSNYACPEHEILVSIKNNHASKSLQNIKMNVRAFNPGYSDPVVSGYVYTDRIVSSGKTIQSCLQVQNVRGNRRVDYDLLKWEYSVSQVVLKEK